MSKLDKHFEYLGLSGKEFNYQDKQANINNEIRYMLNRTNIMFRYHNLPDSIPAYELEKLLQCHGFVVICKPDSNLYAVYAGLGGVTDVYYRPTQAVVTIPYLNYNATLDIDKDCVVILNDSMGAGLLPLYNKYCSMLVENDITMILANYQKRIQNYISANDDNTIASANEFLKQIIAGKLGVIAESQLFDSLKVSNGGINPTNGMRDLTEYHTYLKANLFNEVGLSANANLKKERVTYAEIQLNSDNLYPLVDNMLEHRRIGIEKVNELFGTDIQVELNSAWDYRAINGKSIHNIESEIDIDEVKEIEENEPTGNEIEPTGNDSEPTGNENEPDGNNSEPDRQENEPNRNNNKQDETEENEVETGAEEKEEDEE